MFKWVWYVKIKLDQDNLDINTTKCYYTAPTLQT